MRKTCLGFGLSLILSLTLSWPVLAQNPAITYAFDGTFEDATFSVESAILDAGLVID